MADLDPAKDRLHFDDATGKVNDVVVDYDNNYKDNRYDNNYKDYRKLPASTPATLRQGWHLSSSRG